MSEWDSYHSREELELKFSGPDDPLDQLPTAARERVKKAWDAVHDRVIEAGNYTGPDASEVRIQAALDYLGPFADELYATGKWELEYVEWLIFERLHWMVPVLSDQELAQVRWELSNNAILHRLEVAQRSRRGRHEDKKRKQAITTVVSRVPNWRDDPDALVEELLGDAEATPPASYRDWAHYLLEVGSKRFRQQIDYLIRER